MNRLLPVEFGALFILLTGTITMAFSSLVALRFKLTEKSNAKIEKRNTTQANTNESLRAPVVGANLNIRSSTSTTTNKASETYPHAFDERRFLTPFVQVASTNSGTWSILSRVCSLAI